MDIKKTVTDLVSNDQLEAALDALEEYIRQSNKNHMSQIAVLKGNLVDIKNKSIMGVLEAREEQVQRNKIRLSIVQFVDSIEKKSINTEHDSKEKKQRLIFSASNIIKFFLILALVVILLVSWRMCNSTHIGLDDLYQVVDAPPHERESVILSLGFSGPSDNDNGKSYSKSSEKYFIEDWQSGIVRLITSDKNLYLSLKKEIEEKKFEYQQGEDNTNNKGDKFFNYKKGSKELMIGSFARSNQFLIVFSDTTKRYEPKYFIKGDELFGKWGRIQELGHTGNYELRNNFTFDFLDSEDGLIKGEWYIDGREIVLNYKSAKDRYGYNHKLSNKSEVVVIDNKDYNEITGKIKGDDIYPEIILRRIK